MATIGRFRLPWLMAGGCHDYYFLLKLEMTYLDV